MKKSVSSFSIAILLLINITGFIWSQDVTDFNINRRIILNGDSEKQEIVLPISEQNGTFTLRIKSTIQEGELTIEVYDPKGEKQGNFSVGCQLSTSKSNNKTQIEQSPEVSMMNKEMIKGLEARGFSDEMIKKIEANAFKLKALQSLEGIGNSKETVNGQILRTIIKPMSGNWLVKIIPKNAKGILTIESSQRSQESLQTSQESSQKLREAFQTIQESFQTSLSQNKPFKTGNIVTGTITDTTNRPILGTAIIVKGTKIGTISDINGNFSLPLPVNAKTLVFSFVGMKSQEVVIGDQTRFTITLKRDYNFKGDIIEVGYGTRKQPQLF